MNNLKWLNLKQNKCPKCDKDFIELNKMTIINNSLISCSKCDFRISVSRYEQIVNDMIRQEVEAEYESK